MKSEERRVKNSLPSLTHHNLTIALNPSSFVNPSPTEERGVSDKLCLNRKNQNSKIQHRLKADNSKFKIQNSKLKTQNSYYLIKQALITALCAFPSSHGLMVSLPLMSMHELPPPSRASASVHPMAAIWLDTSSSVMPATPSVT